VEISLDTLKKWGSVVAIVIVATIAIVYLYQQGVFGNILEDAPLPEDETLSAQAAELGIETAFTLDYENDTAEDWLERLCTVSTARGCEASEVFLKPAIETILTEEQPQTGCTAKALEKVDEGTEEDGVGPEQKTVYQWEVWKVEVTLDNPWEGAEESDTVFVQVDTEEGEWKFVRILLDEEIEKYTEVTK